ncbi:LamG-like jellyroll fold domain-containing protein [Gelidibacter japonicus]|uniref:LamG-like jellyroll fold domain-containing protein n=1 Tax=Gelidibacter japonicus TaxID=1962232 RepID=UPI003A8DAA6A
MSILFCVLAISCVDKKPQANLPVAIDNPKIDFQLTDGKGIKYENAIFSEKGAEFTYQDFPSYAKIDSLDLSLSKGINISFWFRFTGNNPKNEQMIFSIRENDNILKNINFWVAGRRLTGRFNSNNLWAKEYNYEKGGSREYYDLFQLEEGKYYFFSSNINEEAVEVYLNSELYARYQHLKNAQIDINSIYLGIMEEEGNFKYQFQGNIRDLKMFDKMLNSKEIQVLSIESYDVIFPYNDAYELSKFNREE